MSVLPEWAVNVGNRLRTTDGEDAGNGSEATEPDRPRTSLYACAECNTVYIAVTKIECATCESTVEQVPSTLAEPV